MPLQGIRPIALALGLALLLNAVLSFDNLWPTPAIRPDSRISLEFLLVWLALLGIVGLPANAARRATGWLAVLVTTLVVGRYLDVTAPALFGRPISLYWDGRELPDVVGQLAAHLPTWQKLVIGPAVIAALWLLHRGVQALLRVTLVHAAPLARRTFAGRALTVAAGLLVAANLAGAEQTWPYVSRPLVTGWMNQIRIVLQAMDPARSGSTLPASPAFSADLAPLHGGDFYLIFSESYGVATLDDPAFSRPLQQDRARLAGRIASAGAEVVSMRVRSPTFGGASWLAHAALLSGVDTRDPARYQFLLTTDRDNLPRMFNRQGYRTLGVIPGLRTRWPEGRFYAWDRLFDSRTLDYRGPEFGYWRIPDQYTVAKVETDEPGHGGDPAASRPPRFLFFATISSHIPFRPLPPFQPQWNRLLGPEPFDPELVADSLAKQPDWLNLQQPYIESIRYSFAWLADLVDRSRPGGATLLVLGDHQPAASVIGQNAAWDVPVHLISSDPTLIARARRLGFLDGLAPAAPAQGLGMHELTRILIDVLSGPTSDARQRQP